MKITATIKKWEDDISLHTKGSIKEIVEHTVTFCCEASEHYWNQAIGFGRRFREDNKNSDVNIYFKTRGGVDGWLSEAPIRFCPFCGETIEVVFKGDTP